jgi:hypothetical protein
VAHLPSGTARHGHGLRAGLRRLAWGACVLLAGFHLTHGATPLAAQALPGDDGSGGITVVGELVDGATGAPLATVQVVLRPVPPPADRARGGNGGASPVPPASGGDTLRTHEAWTDAAGRFVMEGVQPARYTLETGRIGYADLSQEVLVRGASPFEIRIRLAPEAVPLEGVVVTSARSPRLSAAGFYERQGRGVGEFLTYDQIRARGANRTADLLARFAGVRVITSGRGAEGIVTLRGGCRPDIVIDGLNLGPSVSPDEVVLPSDLEAVELYRGPGAPVHYTRSSCGAVILWSADPAMRSEGARPMSWRRTLVAAAFVLGAVFLTR